MRSVMGRLPEHSRIFVFGNGGKPEVYLGSADWMRRNIYERVEVMFHLRNELLCNQVVTRVVEPYLADSDKTQSPVGRWQLCARNGCASGECPKMAFISMRRNF